MSKPIQYVVVTDTGNVYDCNFKLDRQRAEDVARGANDLARESGDLDVYRAALIVELPEAEPCGPGSIVWPES